MKSVQLFPQSTLIANVYGLRLGCRFYCKLRVPDTWALRLLSAPVVVHCISKVGQVVGSGLGVGIGVAVGSGVAVGVGVGDPKGKGKSLANGV